MRKISGILGLFLALASLPAWAADDKKDEVSADAGMDVSGTIVVGADGSVRKYTIDDAKRLSQQSPAVLEFVQHSIQTWKFEPQKADGRPANIKLRAYMRLIASKREDGNFDVRMTGINLQPWTDGNTKMSAGQAVNTRQASRPMSEKKEREQLLRTIDSRE
jgi:hypothetical protein